MIRAREEREAAIRAEAAVWLSRVRSDDANMTDIANFQVWLAEDVRHQRAFDAVTSVWEAVGGVGQLKDWEFSASRAVSGIPRRAMLLGAGLVGIAAGIWQFSRTKPQAETYATQIGEQRRVALADGSLAILDTDSSIEVAFDQRNRTIQHIRGRAHFEVAHDAEHPFVVDAGDVHVVALGTAFDVALSETSLGVVLVTGKVKVTPSRSDLRQTAVELHSPGEHIVYSGETILRHDTLDLSTATAWQSGRAVFDDETLEHAVAEMNRYSRRPIKLAGNIRQLRISGIYSTGDTEAFATSLAALLPVAATYGPASIVLSAKTERKLQGRN
jgi:transmembrane sensor